MTQRPILRRVADAGLTVLGVAALVVLTPIMRVDERREQIRWEGR